jgi:ketosteroid isomerase-like protein
MNNQSAVVQMLLDYYAAFNTHDVRRILPYFDEPALLLAPQGGFAAPSRDALASPIAALIDSLRAKGFGRSELRIGRLEGLSATATLVTGVAIRYTTAGPELERAGLTYVLHHVDGLWKIAVLIAHDVATQTQPTGHSSS